MSIWPRVYLSVKHGEDEREASAAVEFRGPSGGTRGIGVLTHRGLQELSTQVQAAINQIEIAQAKRRTVVPLRRRAAR